VAITVQLIEASSDQHIWSQTYERDLSDILAIRREIAQTVAREIRIATSDEEQRPGELPKVNPAAYEHYLRAVAMEGSGDTEERSRTALAAAAEAVRIDSNFAPAQAALAHANAKLWWYHWDRSPVRAEQARAAADRAVELDPQLGEAHRAKGYVYYWVDLDYPNALTELQRALDRNPNDSEAVLGIAAVQRRQGRVQDAVRNFERATELNPRDSLGYFNLGETYALLRRPEDADRSYDNAIAISSYARPFAFKLRWRLRIRPELQQAVDVERHAEAAGVGQDPLVLYHRVMLHLYAGDPRASLRLLATSNDAFEDQFWYVPRAFLEGQAYEALGDRVHARVRYADAKRLIAGRLAKDPDDSRCHSALGLALAALGDANGAVREGKTAVDGMPLAREAYRGVYRLEDLGRIYALTGQVDAAIDTLARVLSMPDDLSVEGVLLDPAFRRLRGHPGLQKLVARSSR
jgi:serine/threonine-protein kinase